MSTWIEGTVQRVVYTAPESGYAVVRLLWEDEEHTVVGSFADSIDDLQGCFLALEGAWEEHSVHGMQFRASGSLSGAPRTLEGLKLYLASGGLPGIGRVLAGRIVDAFGIEVLGILSRSPERLTEIEGIGKGRAAQIKEKWTHDEGERALVIMLRAIGVSSRLVHRVRLIYGENAGKVVRETPYRLADEVQGIGFNTADQLAMGQGVPKGDPARVKSAILHVLRQQEQRGHCYIERRSLIRGCVDLGVGDGLIEDGLGRLSSEGKIVIELQGEPGEKIWRLAVWAAEGFVGDQIRQRLSSQLTFKFSDADITEAEQAEGINLDLSQRAALKTALQSQICIITGGPGTGKTTILKVYMRIMEQSERLVKLASPTGRASRRLAAATSRPASTLHRLLEARPDLGGFQRNQGNPLELDGLVIDEMSMVDLGLFEGVLKAVRGHSTLVLVGDPDQLPSVGAGAVLRDLLESGAVPAARLVEVHRQAKESGIIHGARRILKGQLPDSGENAGFSDFFRVHRDPPEQVVAALRLVMTERLPRLGFDSSTLQVLAPTKKGALGTIALNASIREWVNPGGDPIRRGGREFRVGDRVICVQNQHDLEVYNGDIGYIRSFDKKGLLIEFESRLVSWAFEDIGMLNLGYAVTVHKSQGSEYPAIILILHTVHGIMLQRTLVYTATTRAKRFCCVLGDRDAWPRALSNTTRTHRNTNLAARLSGG